MIYATANVLGMQKRYKGKWALLHHPGKDCMQRVREEDETGKE